MKNKKRSSRLQIFSQNNAVRALIMIIEINDITKIKAREKPGPQTVVFRKRTGLKKLLIFKVCA